MFSSELIVGLWFVPVVLFIIIPLSMLCAWSVQKFFGKLTDRVELIHTSAKQAREEAPATGLRPRLAV